MSGARRRAAVLGVVLSIGCSSPSESTCGAETEGCGTGSEGSSSAGPATAASTMGAADSTMSSTTAGSASGASSTDATTASTTASPDTTAGADESTTASTLGSGSAEGSDDGQASSSTGEPITCPNGAIDAGEDCDGSDLGGNTCVSLGFAGGALGCASDCSFDATACAGLASCGNGVLDPGEQCDGDDLGGASCESAGDQFGGGSLGCNDNCGFDTAGCCVGFANNCSVHECCGDLLFCGLLTQLCL
jgi:hypothetical protein